MKLQSNAFKWVVGAIMLAIFSGFVVASPSAYAQEESPLTPTPSEPLLTPEPLQAPEILQENAPQTLLDTQSAPLPAEEWSNQADISYTQLLKPPSPAAE